MLTKIYLKFISDTVILIRMSFISLGFCQNDIILHFVAIFLHKKKSFNITKQIKTPNFFNLEYYIVFNLQNMTKWLIYLKTSTETNQFKTST